MAGCFPSEYALYNAARQERCDAWRLAKTPIGFGAQCQSVTVIRREDPAYLALNAQSLQVTLKRLDLAFAAFFRRVKEGAQEPGFPRFKGRDRFPGFGFKTHGDGFKFQPDEGWRHGKLRLSGIGTMRARVRHGRRGGWSAATSSARRTAGSCRW
jgi:putative transposase